MESFVIVSVWYNKDKFIFNTSVYPFLHNIEYHNNIYNYIVYYFIEEDCDIPNIPSIQFIDFKKMFKEYTYLINKENKVGNKIDIMKLILIKECEKINYNYILYMDMDCEIINFDIKKIKNNKRFIEPFFDESMETLCKEYLDVDIDFDFYIENYAFLLNKDNKKIDEINFKNKGSNNICWVYKQYVKIIYQYYYEKKNYIFPKLFEDLEFENSIDISFERGHSWKIQNNFKKEIYVYNRTKKPVYQKVLCELYYNILDKDVKEVRKKIITLLELDYKFIEKFNWSNSLQKDVNLYGVLKDRWSEKEIKKLNDLIFFKKIIVY